MRLIGSLVAALLFLIAPIASGAPEKRLNVLFIAVDDLRPQLGCYGQPHMKTPHIDALANSGVLFNRAYVQQAVCSPSRISLLTGRRPDTTKIYDLETHLRATMPDVVTLPQHFRQQGYHAQSFGKIYHGALNDKQSWSVPHTPIQWPNYGDPKIMQDVAERRKALEDQGVKPRQIRRRVKGPAWEAPDVADGELPDGKAANAAIEALGEVKDKPFFLAVGL